MPASVLRRATGALALLLLLPVVQAAPVLVTSDFIAAPTGFNGFENAPAINGALFAGGAGPHIEDGIRVEQVSREIPDGSILVGGAAGLEGLRYWVPNGGDKGYTWISLESGADFDAVSLLFRAGGAANVAFSLLDDGLEVLSGTLLAALGSDGRIGFAGGGFDTLRLRAGDLGAGIDSGVFQSLWVDSIKVGAAGVPLPAPATPLLVLTALALALRRPR